MPYLTIKRVLSGILFFCLANPLLAATPILTISALTSTTCMLPSDGACLVEYNITNNTNQSLERPIPNALPGLTNLNSSTSDSNNNCRNLTTLNAGASCMISLLISAENLPPGGIQSGPRIRANPFWISQPPPDQQLHVTSTGIPANATLSGSNLALSVNDTATHAALTGKPRKIMITNTGTETATNVIYTISPALPSGASITPANCGDIAPGGTCTLTVTPGQTATTVPLTLYAFGTNSSLLSIQLDILTYGNIYQSGYVFAMDDTTTDTSSVGGKVAALKNQAPLWPFGVVWLSNGQTNCSLDGTFAACTDYTVLPGIDENSTVAGGDACNGNSDGACDTNVIVSYANNTSTNPFAPVNSTLYGAGLCKATIGGFTDWYLPAICDMGYYQPAPHTGSIDSGCGTEATPLQQNMLSNLFNRNVGHLFGVTWSSTQYSTDDGTYNNAWSQYYLRPNQTSNVQTHDGKENPTGVRCVRDITQP